MFMIEFIGVFAQPPLQIYCPSAISSVTNAQSNAEYEKTKRGQNEERSNEESNESVCSPLVQFSLGLDQVRLTIGRRRDRCSRGNRGACS